MPGIRAEFRPYVIDAGGKIVFSRLSWGPAVPNLKYRAWQGLAILSLKFSDAG